MTLSGAMFPHQFLLSCGKTTAVDGWNRHRYASFSLSTHPALPVRMLRNPAGGAAGFVLGWPISPAEDFPPEDMAAPCEIVTDNTARLEEWIYGFGGRFAFILLGSNVKRFYPDAGATLGTVYSPRRRAVASTVSVMVLEEATHPVWSQPEGVFPDNRPDRFYPVGLTMDGEIRRLLPNHYLDFSTWQSVRQYPPPDVVLEEIQPGDVRNAVAQMVQCIRFQIRAVASNASRIYMPLTAGMDSRMLLACAQEVRERIEFITFDYLASGRQRKWLVDLDIAKRLAKRFCLSHRVVPVPVVPPSGEALKYLQRIGFSGGAGKARDFYWANCRHLDMDAAWLS